MVLSPSPAPALGRARAQEALLALGGRPGHTAAAQLGIAVAVVLGGVFVVTLRDGLGTRFSSDGELIARIAAGEFAPEDDRSFGTVGALYAWLGLESSPTTAALLGFGAFALCFLPLLRPAVAGTMSSTTLVLALGGIGLGAIYLGDYAKDVWVLPVIAAFLLIRRAVLRELVLAAGIAVYATYLRQYWFLVYAFYLVLRLATWHGRSWRPARAAAATAALLIGCALLFPWSTGSTIGAFRLAINADRAGASDAQSAIEPIVSATGPVAEAANALLTQLTLYVPLPLLVAGGPVYLVASVFLVVLWCAFLRAVVVDPWPSASMESSWPAACLVIAFTTVQGIFEPDYGSALRHLTPVLLLVLAVLVGHDRLRAPRLVQGVDR